MSKFIESIVIVTIDKDKYVASLRFSDKKLDCEMSSTNKNKLYNMISYKVRELYNN